MTSRTLSSNGFKQQIVWNIKSQKWIMIAFIAIRLLIAALLSSVMCSVTSGSGSNEMMLNSSALSMLNDVTYQLTSPLMVIDIVIGSIFSFIVLNTLFSFLYSKRKTDLYHGFPITRGAFYWAAIAVPMIVNAVSLLGEFAVIAIISKVNSAKSFADLGIIFLSEVLIFAILAATTGVFAFSISVSGVVASYIINIFLLLIMLPVSVFALFTSFESIIPAFANTFENIWTIFPYGLLLADISGDDIAFAVSIPASLGVAVISLLAGLYFYKTRKSESSESHPSSGVPFNIGVMGVAAFAGVVAYISSKNIFTAIIAAAVVAFIAMFAMNYISEKRIRKSTVFYWLGFSFVFAGIMLTAKYGTQSYSNRIPEVSQIESVEVDTNVYGYGTVDFVSRLFGNSYMSMPSVKLEQEASFKNVTEFHKEALSTFGSEDTPTSHVKLIYHLKDGETITRVLPYEYLHIENEGSTSSKLLETFEKIQKSDEYLQKQSMPYEKEDLASVYVSINNRALLLEDEKAQNLFEKYLMDISDTENNSAVPDIYGDRFSAESDTLITESGGSSYNVNLKFVFFTDKTTDAAKKAFDEIPLDAYNILYQSNSMINIYSVQINTKTYVNTMKALTESNFFSQTAALSNVEDYWDVVITPIEYSADGASLLGKYEFVYPVHGGDSWLLSTFQYDLESNTAGDILIKTTVNEEFDFDREYLLQKAESFNSEQAIEDLRYYKKGYVYYFVDDSDSGTQEATKLYFTTALK